MLARQFPFAARLHRLRSAFDKTPTRFVGIDIGSRSIHVAALSRADSKSPTGSIDQSLKWRMQHCIPMTIDPLKPPAPEWIDTTIQTLVDQLPRCVDGEHNLVSLALPISWVHYQVVLGSELESSRTQCDEMFGGSIFQSGAHLCNWPVVGLQHGMPNQDDQYVVAAVAEDAAFRVASTIDDLGYHVQKIVPHGVALIDAAPTLTSVSPHAVALLNREGGLVAINHTTGCGLCRSLPPVPANVLRLNIDEPLTVEDIRPWLSDIAAEINATIRYSAGANMNTSRDEPLLICGDLAEIADVDVVLAKLTNLPVATWQFNGHVRPNRRHGYSQETIQSNANVFEHDAQCALALSLAHDAATTGMRSRHS